MINILLVEDHELYRLGTALTIEKAEDLSLVGEAVDGLDGVDKAQKLKPDVILMDIGLPNLDGIQATQRIKDFMPEVKVLVLTSRNSENDIFDSFKAGADGYIMKGANTEQTLTAIRSVYQGVGWIDPAIAKLVFSRLQSPVVAECKSTEIKENIYGLTKKELSVLELLVAGMSNEEIGEEMVISSFTVKTHVHNILQKLNTTSRSKATTKAIKEGLV